ncbi:hypothetical protein BOX15_Mlig000275g1, partial [Macrostomum lignano]
ETASSGPPKPATTSEPQPPQQQCAYFVARKQRQCRLRPLPGQSLCVEHCPAGSAAPGDSRGHRIPCPLDPKHTVYASQLDRHLTRCNSRPRLVGQPFYRQGVNSCDSPEDRTRDLSWSLLDPPEHVHRRLDQIIALVDSLIPDSDVADQPGDADQPIWPMMAAQLSNAARRAATSFKSNKRRINKKPPAQKVQSYSSSSDDDDDEDDDGEGGGFENGEPRAVTNLRQQANLLALAEKSQLLRSPCAYFEFGAGKGHLCHWVARYWFESNNTVPVSMATTDSDPIASAVGNPVSETPASSKQKGGKKLAAPAVTTSAADVRAASRCGVTALGKHLCGAATDLALRCLAGLDSDAEDGNSRSHGCSDSKRARIAGQLAEADRSTGVGPVGGVIALCCHQRCLWSAYVGKRRMASLGIGPEDFHAISRMAGWATCASKAARLKRKPQEDRRELIGLKCKRLIDSGRVAFLTEQLGYSARLVRYAKRSDTPENCALLFSRGI